MKTKMIVTSGLVAATLVFSSFAMAQGPGRQGGGSATNGAGNYQRGPAMKKEMRGDTNQERIRLQDQLQKKEQKRAQERVREHQPEDAQKRTRQQSGALPDQASDTARAAREYSGQGQGTAEAVRATQGEGQGRMQRQGGSDATAPIEE